MHMNWDPKSPSLLPTIVCYADILGFRAMTVKAIKSGEDEVFLQRIKSSLSEAYEIVRKAQTLDGAVPSMFDMKVFTDNIVIAFPLYNLRGNDGEAELATLLMILAQVQAKLASNGFFLRGGITADQHYQDDDIAYGKALLDAVDLDKSGGPPRLVVGSTVESMIAKQLSSYGNGWAPHYEEFLEDSRDERWFVNYLGLAFEFFPDGPIDYGLLAAHSANVRRGLSEHESDLYVRAKYEWLAMYHNYVCRTFANQHPVLDGGDVDPEWAAVAEDAQKALNYLVPFAGVPTAQPLRRIDAQRLSRNPPKEGV